MRIQFSVVCSVKKPVLCCLCSDLKYFDAHQHCVIILLYIFNSALCLRRQKLWKEIGTVLNAEKNVLFSVILAQFCLFGGKIAVEGRRWERAFDLQYMWPLDNSVDENVCAKNMQRIYHGHVVAPIPPDISGDWTSSKWVLTKYVFYFIR